MLTPWWLVVWHSRYLWCTYRYWLVWLCLGRWPFWEHICWWGFLEASNLFLHNWMSGVFGLLGGAAYPSGFRLGGGLRLGHCLLQFCIWLLPSLLFRCPKPGQSLSQPWGMLWCPGEGGAIAHALPSLWPGGRLVCHAGRIRLDSTAGCEG